jgi:mono/diheme cytochrome c family protein
MGVESRPAVISMKDLGRVEGDIRSTHPLAPLLVLFSGLVICAACAAPGPMPSSAPTTVEGQLTRGAVLYTQGCASSVCHGANGAGIRSGGAFQIWPTVGEAFRARNPNAQVIFDVVRSGGSPPLRALRDQQIYDAIAYELSLNDVRLAMPLTAQNAAGTASGAQVPAATNGRIYPPPANVSLLAMPPFPRPLTAASNGAVEVRIDQWALVSRIGRSLPPPGGSFLMIVFALRDMSAQSLDVDPRFLHLMTSREMVLEPQVSDLAYPVEPFHHETIEPEHGTAAVATFALPAWAVPSRLIYDDHSGPVLSLDLAPLRPGS